MRALRLLTLDVQSARERVEVQSAIELARRGQLVPKEQFIALTKPERGRVDMYRPDHNSRLKGGAENRMAMLDRLPADFRELANEHGLPIVDAFYRAGITDARIVHRLICLTRGLQPDGRPAAFGNRRVGKAASK